MGWFMAKNKWWESIVLVFAAFMLFRPGFFMDRISPAERHVEPTVLVQELAQIEQGKNLKLKVAGVNPYGKEVEFYAQLPILAGNSSEERLQALGITLLEQNGKVIIDNVELDSPAAKTGLNWDQTVLEVLLPQNSLPKEVMFIPALLLIFGVGANQRRRKTA
jgi:hypothetical protein